MENQVEEQKGEIKYKKENSEIIDKMKIRNQDEGNQSEIIDAKIYKDNKNIIKNDNSQFSIEKLYQDDINQYESFDIDDEKQKRQCCSAESLQEQSQQLKQETEKQIIQESKQQIFQKDQLQEFDDYFKETKQNETQINVNQTQIKPKRGRKSRKRLMQEYIKEPHEQNIHNIEFLNENELDKEKKQSDFKFFQECSLVGSQVNKGPRRPLSPYIFFSQEKRKELKLLNPNWNSQQIMKQVSILWQKMSIEEKAKFQVLSKDDRDRYEQERTDFVQQKDYDYDYNVNNIIDTV